MWCIGSVGELLNSLHVQGVDLLLFNPRGQQGTLNCGKALKCKLD